MRDLNGTAGMRETQPDPIDGTDGGEPATVTSQVGPWAMVPVWVFSMGLTSGEIAVYVSLRSYCDRNGNCFPKTRTIAERAHCSVSAVRNAVQKFRRLEMLTTTDVYRPDSRELWHMRYHLMDLDPRRWNVEPRDVSLQEVTPPHSGEGHVSLSQVTQEHTNEHPTEQTNETSSSRASSSSSTRARKTRTPEDEEEARKKRVATRKRRERTRAKKKIIERTGTDDEMAEALLDYLVDQYGANDLPGYVDGMPDEDLDARLEEATWEIEAERVAERNRAEAADGIMRQVAKSYPDADLTDLRAAYIGALRQGHTGEAVCAALNATLDRRHRGDPIDDYIAAIEALGQPVAA